MNLSTSRDPVAMVAALTRAAAKGEERFVQVLEQVPVAAYRTDRDGAVTHFNRACVPFAGRRPIARRDRWCVTWKLYKEDGTFLPHDQCPMAVALHENRQVRGARAVAERPDGVRVPFAPYPTPLRDERGKLVGAVNLLVDLSDPDHQAFCREQAAECRRLAGTLGHQAATAALLASAADYESWLPRVASGQTLPEAAALPESRSPTAAVTIRWPRQRRHAAPAALRRGRAVRHFQAIFAQPNEGGLETFSLAAPDFSAAFAALVALEPRRPFELWCDGSYFGRFQLVVEGGASYWRMVDEFTGA